MLSGQSESKTPEPQAPQLELANERELRLRKEGKRIVTVEECGRIIGKIISPVEGDVFGPWRGAVYLTRE